MNLQLCMLTVLLVPVGCESCGRFAFRERVVKIFGGEPSSRTHWPWVVFIKITRGYNEEICTGRDLKQQIKNRGENGRGNRKAILA